ncbi:hypothetical protein KXQ82_06700 [Mucilaginibacter sp. HMF5004]|uniref:hypothetical protein n=1 Tax=Mucilaginibacter rivuli TaxID=2857527 RepID=UPI001C5E5C83|nr:hypothetical protein [Mucilaginibacter rivuli]MBW4889395.1 hypothetical protein [Mucilaginibacter rivuli]
MKAKILTSAILISGFLTGMAAFADMSGKWEGTVMIPGGNEIPLTYVFKIDGDKLTGNIETPEGELAIKDGKVDGKTFTFGVDVSGHAIKTSGKYYAEADSVGLDIDFAGDKTHSKLLRSKLDAANTK